MTLKKYNSIRIVVAMLLAVLISQSIVLRNYVLPIMGIAFSMGLLFYLRSKLKDEVLADERDYTIGGTSARWAIQIFDVFAVIVMIILYAKQDLNPSFLPVAITLAYSVCFLMILYALIFRYFDKIVFLTSRKVYAVIGIMGIVLIALFGLRLFSGEDDWMCQDGQWVKHGNPSFPAPRVECTK